MILMCKGGCILIIKCLLSVWAPWSCLALWHQLTCLKLLSNPEFNLFKSFCDLRQVYSLQEGLAGPRKAQDQKSTHISDTSKQLTMIMGLKCFQFEIKKTLLDCFCSVSVISLLWESTLFSFCAEEPQQWRLAALWMEVNGGEESPGCCSLIGWAASSQHHLSVLISHHLLTGQSGRWERWAWRCSGRNRW